MHIGYIGLGKMGKNMVLRLLEQGIEITAWNRSAEPVKEVVAAGAKAAMNIPDLVSSLPERKIVWVMLPANVTQEVIERLVSLLSKDDIIIDGANSHYKESQKKGELCAKHRIKYIDIGVSGGPSGARNGACCMVGGDSDSFALVEPLVKAASAPHAYQHFPGLGAGHFVKMVHNGIEYGMMQAIAEGFTIMKQSDYNLNLEDVTKIYNNRSVVESRLIGWTQSGFEKYGQDLEEFSGSIGHLGEGKWTVETAEEMGIPVPVIADSFKFRLDSTDNPSYTGKVVQMLRNQFGGHTEKDTLKK